MPAPTPGTRELACLLLSLSLSNAVAAAPPAAVPVPATAAQHAEPAHATLPTPDATREYDWLTVGEPSGSQTVERRDDGTVVVDFAFNDRGRGPDTHTELALDANGIPVRLRTTGVNYMKGEVDEQFTLVEGTARWQSAVESGERRVDGPAVYVPANSFPEYTAVLARALLAAPENTLPLLPAGRATIRALDSITLDGEREITLYAISGLDAMPEYLWLDGDGRLYGADYNWFAITPKGEGQRVAALKARQEAATDRYLSTLAGKLRRPLAGLVAITDVRLFDSLTGEVHPQATVFLNDGVISAVYHRAVAPGEGVEVIDGRGMLLMPALWDMHAHLFPASFVNYLASGVTNVRDMANDPAFILRTRRDAASGRIAAPDVYPMGFIDRRGEFAAPTGMLADSLEQALGFVDWYAQRGFHGIKLYSSIEPAWVAPIAERAHSLGLSVLGHIPSGMSAEQAVRAGFDEITHVNMVLLNFLGADTIDTRTPQRFVVPIREAGGIDPWSAEVSRFVSLMQARGTAHDPTYSLFMQMFTNVPGEVSALARPFIGHLPPVLARSMLNEEGFNAGLEAEGYEAAVVTRAIVRRLHDAGIRLLPGTDWGPAGFALIRELMYYADAGIPPAEVLQLATIEAARHMHVDQQLGSVSPGKRAHLLLVPGDPTEALADLYRVALVIKDAAAYEPAAMLTEVGFLPFE